MKPHSPAMRAMITALTPLAIVAVVLKPVIVTATEVAAPRSAANVAAASSLRHLWPELASLNAGAAFARVSFASSGNLLRQIRQGAPFGLFLSANASYADILVAEGFAQGPATLYAFGELALLGRPGVFDHRRDPLGQLAAHLADGQVRRVAIANPQHAPYGMAARSVLKHLGLAPDGANWLSLGENAAQALQFLLAGAVDVALVPLSLSRQTKLPVDWSVHRVDPALHDPIRHKMVLLDTAGAAERAVFDFLLTPTARRAFATHGFTVPPDNTAD